jgi:hypothetical protein
MKHVKPYNVSERSLSDEVRMIKMLKSRRLITHEEYLRDLFSFAKERGMEPGSLLEPGDYLFEIQTDEYLDEDNLDDAKEWLQDWRGHKGERVVRVTGTLGETGCDFDILLSSGAQVHFYWEDRSEWGPDSNTIRVGGRKWSLSEEEWTRITNEYYADDYGWHQYMHGLLSATVRLSY